MEKLRDFYQPITDDSTTVICVVKNEYLLLEYFIRYYKNIGITHFIFINNNSSDETVRYLLDHSANIMLFSTNESYKDNNYGVTWVTNVLNTYCINKWCAVVDTDELLFIDNLNNLKWNMKKNGANACKFYLLDMYPKDQGKIYKKGENFVNHSEYYDKESNINNDLWCGVRKRVFNLRVCLQKKSFFLYNFSCCCKLSCGYHWLENFGNHNCIKYYNEPKIVLHFKFIKPNLKEFFNQRVSSNQDWDNSNEYRSYLEKNIDSFYDKNHSVLLRSGFPHFSFLKDM